MPLSPCGHGLLELPDLRHTLVDIGTTLLCIGGHNGLPGRTLPINLIQETARRSEREGHAALSSAVKEGYFFTPPKFRLCHLGKVGYTKKLLPRGKEPF